LVVGGSSRARRACIVNEFQVRSLYRRLRGGFEVPGRRDFRPAGHASNAARAYLRRGHGWANVKGAARTRKRVSRNVYEHEQRFTSSYDARVRITKLRG